MYNFSIIIIMLIQERPLLLVLAMLLLLGIPSTIADNVPGAPKVSEVKSKQDAMESCKDPAKADIDLYVYKSAEDNDIFYSCKEAREEVFKFGRKKSCNHSKDGNFRWPAPFTKVVDGVKYPGIYYDCDRRGRANMMYCSNPKPKRKQIRGCSNLRTVEQLAIY